MYEVDATHLVLNTNKMMTGVFGALFGRQGVISGPYSRKQCMDKSEVHTTREYLYQGSMYLMFPLYDTS